MTLDVPAEAAGERLDRFLASRATAVDSPLAGLSRSRLQALIGEGRVTVDGARARSAHKLKAFARVTVELPQAEPLDLVPEPMPLEILHEDGDIIVLVKPAGLSVHPGAGRRTGTLVNALLARCDDLSGIGGVTRPGIVHRLDRGTSGVMVAAKHDRAHLALARQFAARTVEKRYVAFVLGTPAPRVATIETAYGRHPTERKRFTSRLASGKRALTRYEVVASGGGLSRLEILLGTGRTHQIRVHLADRGHPIAGDALYGGRRYAKLAPATRAVTETLTHQALHAARLAFVHPVSGVSLCFEAALPADLEALWRAMLRV